MTKQLSEFESLEQMAEATAAPLTQAAAQSAFGLFREKEFRRLASLERLSQTEQDRIFNELMVAFLVLNMLLLEAPDLKVEKESRDYLATVGKTILKAHVEHLKTLGVEADHLRDWEKLIAIRYEEYARDRHDVRAAAMELESAEKKLDLHDLAKIQLLVPLQAVAIGCHHHICRGETKGLDELFKLTLKSLSAFYVELRIRFEGGRSNPFLRAKAAFEAMLHRIGKRK